MKTIVLSFVTLLFLSSTGNSQQLKTYKGDYELKSYDVEILGLNPSMLDGTATYTYFEDKDLRRIKKGVFSYNGKFSYNGAAWSVSATGNYLEEKKHGAWTIKQTLNAQGTMVIIQFTGNYKNGLPNGAWTVTGTASQNGKKATESWSINFENNILTGSFKNTNTSSSGKAESILGAFDKEGFFNGKVTAQKDGDEYQFEFKNGLLISSMGRALQSGNVFEREKTDSINIVYFDQLMKQKGGGVTSQNPYVLEEHSFNESYSSIDGMIMRMETLITKKFVNKFKDASLFDLFPGDLSVGENGMFNWKGFKHRFLEKKRS